MNHIIETIQQIIWLFAILCGPFIFSIVYFRALKKRTQNIIAQLQANINGEFLDIKVWFKGFDIMKRNKNMAYARSWRTLYSYHTIDLYVLNDALLVVGKIEAFGMTRFVDPFVICLTDNITANENSYPTRATSLQLTGDNQEIQFKDPDFIKEIRMVVLKVGQPLYEAIKSGS